MKPFNTLSIIVNGNLAIGLGHVYRCLTLAEEAVKHNVTVRFIMPDEPLLKDIIPSNYDVTYVANNTWNQIQEHQDYFKSCCNDSDAIVLDLLENEFLKFSFLATLQKTIVSITSFYYAESNRYETISFFPGVETRSNTTITSKTTTTALYSGPKYLIFREEFKKKFVKLFTNTPPEVIVTMGGTDAFEFTPIVTEALLKIQKPYKATIILSQKAKTIKRVQELVKHTNHITIIHQTKAMATLMHKASVAVINGGLTRYELALTGTPFIALSIHKKQYDITERLTRLVGGVNLGVVSELNIETIKKGIEDLLFNVNKQKAISKALQKTIDSKGAYRMFKIINENVIHNHEKNH